MVIKFVCSTDDKSKYHEIKKRVFFNRATILREKIRELKDEYFAELEVVSFGRTLYRDLKESSLCKHLRLDPNITEDEE